MFAPTEFIGTEGPMVWPGIDGWLGTPHEHELAPMDWDELAALVDAGSEIGSHGRTHPYLTHLDDATLADELEGSRADCEAQVHCRSCRSSTLKTSASLDSKWL